MIPLCEFMSRNIFPTIRSMIAKELVYRLGYTQKEAAEAMGVTQPAITQYLKDRRGGEVVEEIIKHTDLVAYIQSIAGELHRIPREEKAKKLCDICKVLLKSKIPEKYGYDPEMWGMKD